MYVKKIWFSAMFAIASVSILEGHESISSPTSTCELSQSVYPLGLQYGPAYLPLSSFTAHASFQLEWKQLQPVQEQDVICLLQIQDQNLALLGSDLTRLDADLFVDADLAKPVIFFTGQNFEEAGIEIAVDEGLPYLQQSFTLKISAGQKVAAGTYRSFINSSLYTVEGRCIHRQPIQISVEVADYQRIFLGNAQETRSLTHRILDFGEAQATATRTVGLQIESNESCELSIFSMHAGKLVLKGLYGPDEGRSSCIPYDFWVGGEKVSLRDIPQTIWVSGEKLCQKNLEAIVRIYPDVTLNWAGVYEDEIIFSLKRAY